MAFIDIVKFLLSQKVKFVNPRVFSQDHLEQHFSKQRSRSGGSGNPNKGRSIQNDMNIHNVKEWGFRRRGRGNTEEKLEKFQITKEPLPKRKCASRK
ncbi:Zinc finger protein 385A [Frankliniella fusca]|uniref:Zinc finger protein 385A n=1 Tax=Frankliniella fusca TaxID=407009 RepID=A0AAE1I5K9_9NEOP|nr:Zinc finger protein 385A [Frankliniella fusca]